MPHLRLLPLALALLMVAAPASAQVSYDPEDPGLIRVGDALLLGQRVPTQSARSMALAGAGSAALADASALVYNPAALGLYQMSEAGGAFGTLSAEDVSAPAVQTAGITDNDVRNTGLQALSYVYKVPTVRGSLVFAAGYQRLASLDRLLSFDSDVDIPNYGTVRQRGSVLEDGGVHELTFGAAVEVAPKVFVGGTIGVPIGSYTFTESLREDDVFEQDSRVETDAVGVNARFGVTAEAVPGVQVGLTLETPTFLSVSEDFTQDGFDEVGDFGGADQFDYTIRTPWRVGLGAALSSAPFTGETANVRLLGDIEFVDWTQLDLDTSTDPAFFDDADLFARQSLDAVVNARVGVEAQAGGLFLRGGVGYYPDPRDFGFVLEGEKTSDRTRTVYSAGIGYRFAGTVDVDFAWYQERFDDQFEVLDLTLTEEVRRNRFALGARFRF